MKKKLREVEQEVLTEGMFIRFVVNLRRDSDSYLEKLVEKLKELDTAFHRIIYKASGSRVICNILSDLHQNIRTYRKLSLTVPGRLERSINEHREIYEAIAAGNADIADRLTSEHIEQAMQNTLTAIKGEC